jgi:hypothetical protein
LLFKNSFIIQELFFQLIELKKRQSVFEAYFFGRKRAEKMSFKTPMDKAIINKNKNEHVGHRKVVVVKVKVWNIINFKTNFFERRSWEYSNTIILF